MSDNKKIIEVYDAIAEAYASDIETKPYNAFYERPATLSLLPSVKGKTVLDVGCGPGIYASILLEKGAQVIGFDASKEMVDIAKKKIGDKAVIYQHNLQDPLSFVPDNSVDIVLASLVLHYIKDWSVPLQEFYRVLKKDGLFVFSVDHPALSLVLNETENYFDVEGIELPWKSYGISMPLYRRSLTELFSSLQKAGFIVETLLEPQPTQEFKKD